MSNPDIVLEPYEELEEIKYRKVGGSPKGGRPKGSEQKGPKKQMFRNIFSVGAYEGAKLLLEIIRDTKATDTSRIAAAKKMIDVKIAMEETGVFCVKRTNKETGEEKTYVVADPSASQKSLNIISTTFGG